MQSSRAPGTVRISCANPHTLIEMERANGNQAGWVGSRSFDARSVLWCRIGANETARHVASLLLQQPHLGANASALDRSLNHEVRRCQSKS